MREDVTAGTPALLEAATGTPCPAVDLCKQDSNGTASANGIQGNETAPQSGAAAVAPGAFVAGSGGKDGEDAVPVPKQQRAAVTQAKGQHDDTHQMLINTSQLASMVADLRHKDDEIERLKE